MRQHCFSRISLRLALLICLAVPSHVAQGAAAGRSAPGQDVPSGEPALRPVYVYGGNAAFPPYEFLNAQGEPDGFNVALVRELAARAGVEVEIRLGLWEEVLAAFEAGEVQLTSLAHSDARAAQYRLLDRTWTLHQALGFRPGRWSYPERLEALAAETVAVEVQSLMHDLLAGLPEVRRPVLFTTVSQREALIALIQGEATAVAGNTLTLRIFASQLRQADIVFVPVKSLSYHLAVRRGQERDMAWLSPALAELRGSGRFEQLVEEHLHAALLPSDWRDYARYGRAVALAAAVLIVGVILWTASLRRQVRARTEETVRALHGQERLTAELAGSELRFRGLVRDLPVGILLIDADGCIVLANAAAGEILGRTEQEIVGTSLFDFDWGVRRPDGSRYSSSDHPFARALAGARPVRHVEMVLRQNDRHEVWVQAALHPQPAADGGAGQTLCMLEDVTERKQTEEERLRLMREQEHRTQAEAAERRAALLAEASRILGASFDERATLSELAAFVVPALADWCVVDMIGPDGRLAPLAMAGDAGTTALLREMRLRYPPDASDVLGPGRALHTERAALEAEMAEAVLDREARDAGHAELLRRLDCRARMTIPIVLRQGPVGALTLGAGQSGRRFGREDLALAEDLGRRAALAIEHARLYRAEQEARQASENSRERIARLQGVTAALSEAITTTQVADVILEQAMASLDASAGSIAVLSEDGEHLEMVRAMGYPAALLQQWRRFHVETQAPLAEAHRSGEPVLLGALDEHAGRYPALAALLDLERRPAAAALPLVTHGRRLGALGLSFATRRSFTAEDQAFMLALARQCAQALERTRLYEAERDARAEAEAANRAKDEFLATLSHELRTPLNAILGWSHMLRRGKLSPETAVRALDTIERNAQMQAQLVGDLLDVSRVIMGSLSLDIRPVGLEQVVRAAVEAVRPAAEGKSIAVEIESDPTLGPVPGDGARLQQVVWNLLSNAIKFTPGGGRVSVSLAQAGGQAEIRVRDTGAGIEPDFQPHVFERFRQADPSATRRHGGLGLGLAIVRHLVELHGGAVRVESAGRDQGATFVVTLPLLAPHGAPAAPPPSQERPAGLLGGLRVLVVDDEEDTRALVTLTLEAERAGVMAVESAAEALEALDAGSYDVLLSDIGMPEHDGCELMRRVRSRPAEKGGGIRAAALTAYARAEDAALAARAGFELHIAKPVSPDVLVQAVATLAGRAPAGAIDS